MGVGKTAVCRQLKKELPRSVFLDGDWCWCVNPFDLNDPRLREGDKAMSMVLSNYLRLDFEYVVFCSVVAMYENIREGILRDIAGEGYQVIGFTLTCSEETLRERHRKRGDKNECSMEWLRLPHYPGDHVIYTDGKTPGQAAQEMKEIIDGYGD